MKIGDLVRLIPEFAPACLGVILREATNELSLKDFQIYWTNGDSTSWVYKWELELVYETR